jgi:pimeloyl-ACP methyl ester carboxylesterase
MRSFAYSSGRSRLTQGASRLRELAECAPTVGRHAGFAEVNDKLLILAGWESRRRGRPVANVRSLVCPSRCTASPGGVMFVNSRGFRIRYQVSGSGPVLVLLHGFPMWGDRWRDRGYVSVLQGRFHLVVPDLLGHGKSDKPHWPVDYGVPNLASDVIAVLDAAGVERAHVWGYSLGTMVAENLAVTVPDRVLSLTLGGSPPALILTSDERCFRLARRQPAGTRCSMAGPSPHRPVQGQHRSRGRASDLGVLGRSADHHRGSAIFGPPHLGLHRRRGSTAGSDSPAVRGIAVPARDRSRRPHGRLRRGRKRPAPGGQPHRSVRSSHYIAPVPAAVPADPAAKPIYRSQFAA